MKYTPPGGRIEFTCAYMNETMILSIIDSGTGIPPDILSSLFEPYVQASSAKAGTGLGLAICKTFAEKMNGSIVVESVLGHGSTFTVRIPAAAAPLYVHEIIIPRTPSPAVENGTSEVVSEQQQKQQLMALVVDDSKINRMILSTMLKKRNYQVFEAEDGVDAMQLYKDKGPFDCVFSDLNMPRMDGKQLLNEIRTFGTDRDVQIPFILVSGDDNLEGTQTLDPRVFILNKPFDLKRLDRILESIK
jgi:CheY-like chemotaxis protein